VHGAGRWGGCATLGLTIVAVVDGLGLHETPRRAVDREVRRAGDGAGDGDGDGVSRRFSTAAWSGPSPADLAAENARLGRDDARLSMERDIPGKAALI
jgi:transposase